MKIFGKTHQGHVREKNEDRLLIKNLPDKSFLIAAADGMGGEANGEIAAELVIDGLSGINYSVKDIEQHLIHLIKDGHRKILDIVKKDSDLEGMGTTVTSVFVRKNTLHWAHIGDTRLYVLRDQKLNQITTDHNMAQFLIEEGELTVEQARVHPSRNLLDKCAGGDEDCDPDTGCLEITNGDVLILTTDGLHEAISFESLKSILISSVDIESKTESLLNAALDAGGADNITVVLAEV